MPRRAGGRELDDLRWLGMERVVRFLVIIMDTAT